ncbi:MAG: hypothetical protein OXG78_16935 [Chloroflexi bacterium]|nr:hypothetical protein [Chloroflexota bacterium]
MRGFAVFLLTLLLAVPSFAQAGVDNCCQTGRACATEADWVQGWFDYQAGQCAAPAPAATSSTIDNCCQAGRACATEADWIQGWFDYQAGQCPASAPAASSPAATTSTAIDNCCQAGRACASEADWVQGWVDYQNGQCAAPARNIPAAQDGYHFSGQNRVRIGPFTLTRGKWEFNPNLGRNAESFLYQLDSAGNIISSGECLTFPTNFHFYGETGTGLRLRAERHEFAVRSTCQVQLYLYPELSFNEVRGQSWSVSLRKTDGNI